MTDSKTIAALLFAAGAAGCSGSPPPAKTTAEAPAASAATAPPAPTASAAASASPGDDLAVDLPIETGTDGEPDLTTDRAPRIGVWHVKKKGFFLAVTTGGKKRHFKGKVTLSGDATFTKLDQWVDDKEASRDSHWLKPSLKVSDDSKEISFDLVSEAQGVSGVSFNVKGEGQVTWALAIGGAKEKDAIHYAPNDVVIGQNGHHPSSVPFKTWAHPDEQGKGK